MQTPNRVWSSALLSSLPHLGHAFWGREGGASSPPYTSLNLALNTGDRSEDVECNRQRVAGLCGGHPLHILRQEHGIMIHRVVGSPKLDELSGDGLWTTASEQILCVLHADCLPVLIAHRHAPLVAAVHAGWRGLCQRVVSKMLELLSQQGWGLQELYVALGPCLGIRSAEFQSYRTLLPSWAWRYINSLGRLDLRQMAIDQCVEAGIPPGSIEQSDVDTATDPRCFSHRRGDLGRQGSCIWLRQEAIRL